MEQQTPSGVRADAIEWHIRLRHADDAVWEAFAAWLEADTAHAEAYDAVEREDDGLGDLLPGLRVPAAVPVIAAPNLPQRTRRWPVWGGAIAASIAVAAVYAPQFRDSHYDIVTGPGEQRSVEIDGTSIALNGSTRLTLDQRDPRRVELASGEALFNVRHDDTAPFRLIVGDDEVQDVGTVFNAVRQDGETRVAVAEGAVTYNPGREAVPLHAGDSLISRGQASLAVAHAAPGNIGSWRSGRLAFDHEPLARVAADLGRSLGTRIQVAPVIASRQFSGVVQLDRSGPAQLSRLATVLQVDLRPARDGWTMGPARVAAH